MITGDTIKKRFIEEQIINILKEQEAGFSVMEIIRRHDIAEQTFYRWKSKFGYRRLHILLRREGLNVNHKAAHRIYREEGLHVRKRKRKRIGTSGPQAP